MIKSTNKQMQLNIHVLFTETPFWPFIFFYFSSSSSSLALRTNWLQLLRQVPSRWGQSSWWAVWLGHGLLRVSMWWLGCYCFLNQTGPLTNHTQSHVGIILYWWCVGNNNIRVTVFKARILPKNLQGLLYWLIRIHTFTQQLPEFRVC